MNAASVLATSSSSKFARLQELLEVVPSKGAAVKTLWCWRCQQDVPMLDEPEFEVVERLYRDALRPGPTGSIDERFAPVTAAYSS